MQPPPGMHQGQMPSANGMPQNFQPPANLPNINFNAPVIRLGTTQPAPGGRGDDRPQPAANNSRHGLGMERGSEPSRQSNREAAPPVLMPPGPEDKLRTIFVHDIPDGIGERGLQRLLAAVGSLRKWESLSSVMDGRKGKKFGFALFDDVESLDHAVRLLSEQEVMVPTKRQAARADAPEDDTYEDIEKVKLQVFVDESTQRYVESHREEQDESAAGALQAAKAQLQKVIRDLFYPRVGAEDADGDAAMGNNESGATVEVVNIPVTQDDELADIPPELRENVTKEIAAFRERSIQRDMERLRQEEEIEEMERQRNEGSRRARTEGASSTPVGPRGGANGAPSGPRGQNGSHSRNAGFINGGVEHPTFRDDDTDASDDELNRRELSKDKAESDRLYNEAERKWSNRERSRQAALEREQDREKNSEEVHQRLVQEQLDKDKAWDDDKEASRKSHVYYRDHATWTRKRNADKADEEARDEADRRAEHDEAKREQAQMERARGMADSFLDQQAQEIEQREAASAAAAAPAAAPQPFKLSLGAAAQKAQASRAGQRRTIAEVEGLLDNEETDTTTRRQLIPIEYDASTAATASMTDEEISEAVRKLAQEIPSDKEGLWAWQIKWDYIDEGVIRNKLRPFVEKKIVEYLGVQEEMLVEAVEDHLRKHGDAGALVDELEGALDDEAEDLVKKLWRMVIFFAECEKRGLPA